MPAINAETRESWQALANSLAEQRPSKGKRVRVVAGRKHLGDEGVVTWHGINKFSDAYHYASDAQAHLRDMQGRYGWRVRVDTGAEAFFVDADKVEVVQE